MHEFFLNSALKFLAYRPRSEKEVRDNLIKKKASQEVVEQIIVFLTQQKYLNDEEFVRWWIENRLRFRPKSISLIKIELKQKGINEETIERGLQSMKDEVDLTSTMQTDLETAKKIVQKKIYRYKSLSQQEVYHKLGSFLARRGFNWGTIKKSIDHFYETERG